MTHALKKIHVSANARPGSLPRHDSRDRGKGKYAASLPLADLWPANAPAFGDDEPLPTPRYLTVRQLNGKKARINLAGLRLHIYRPQRAARPQVLAMAA